MVLCIEYTQTKPTHTPPQNHQLLKNPKLAKEKKNLFKELRKDLNTRDSGIEFSTTHCSKNCSAIERQITARIDQEQIVRALKLDRMKIVHCSC
jgi:hypothetical protein